MKGDIYDSDRVKTGPPLHLASEHATTIDAMRVLLEAGANPNLLTGSFFGDTARTLAERQAGGGEATKLLSEYSDINEAAMGHRGIDWSRYRRGPGRGG